MLRPGERQRTEPRQQWRSFPGRGATTGGRLAGCPHHV